MMYFSTAVISVGQLHDGNIHSDEKESQLFYVVHFTQQTDMENFENRPESREIISAQNGVKQYTQHVSSIEPQVKIVTRGEK